MLLRLLRRVAVPYPAMLAIAGAAVAFVPGAPTIRIDIDPQTTLALFIAPVLLDAAYDFPVITASALWRPLVVLGTGAVLATAAVVAILGWWAAGQPVAAALGAGRDRGPTRCGRGRGCARHCSATLILHHRCTERRKPVQRCGGTAVVQRRADDPDVGQCRRLNRPATNGCGAGWYPVGYWAGPVDQLALGRFVTNTLGGNVFQFLGAFLVWIVAEHDANLWGLFRLR